MPLSWALPATPAAGSLPFNQVIETIAAADASPAWCLAQEIARRQTAANPDKCRQDVRPHLPPACHFAAKRHFVCGIRVTAVMTPAERQRRRRAKLAEIVHPEHVLAELDRAYSRAYLADQGDIPAGMKKLLRQWEKDAAARARWWRQRTGRATKATARKRRGHR